MRCHRYTTDNVLVEICVPEICQSNGISAVKLKDFDYIYIGNLFKGKKHGIGAIFHQITGLILKDGTFQNDELHGFIKFVLSKWRVGASAEKIDRL